MLRSFLSGCLCYLIIHGLITFFLVVLILQHIFRNLTLPALLYVVIGNHLCGKYNAFVTMKKITSNIIFGFAQASNLKQCLLNKQ